MQGLHYRAIDEQGRVHKGYSSSQSVSELEKRIVQRGWRLLPLTLVQRVVSRLQAGPRLARWPQSAAALFTLNFAQLLSAGVPLLQVIEELIELESQRSVKRALQQVHTRVDQGDKLSEALLSCPGLFSPDYVASVKAGERSGKLAQCLKIQATNLQWQADLTQRFRTVLAYPLFALVCLVCVFLFVLLYLVPSMLPLLSMNPAPLPAYTRLLLNLSELLRDSGLTLLISLSAMAVLSSCFWFFYAPFRQKLQSLLLRGSYGQIVTGFSLARYARTTALLYESGIEITDAMQISQNLIGNALLKSQLAGAQCQVLSGKSIGAAMQSQQALPVLFVRMLMAGERAGVLDVAMNQCADQLRANAQYSLDRVERLIGPVLLCVMGAMLLWVALSVLEPIYVTVSQAGALL